MLQMPWREGIKGNKIEDAKWHISYFGDMDKKMNISKSEIPLRY